MRLSAREMPVHVVTLPEATRPIRLRVGGLTYAMETDEAIGLATQLADAVTQLREEPQP